jgi:hypothetical protein
MPEFCPYCKRLAEAFIDDDPSDLAAHDFIAFVPATALGIFRYPTRLTQLDEENP